VLLGDSVRLSELRDFEKSLLVGIFLGHGMAFKKNISIFSISKIFQTKNISISTLYIKCPRGVGQSVMECIVKALHDVKVIVSKPAGTKNPSMLRVGVAHVGCDPWVILMA
jgi:hypothetical protein